MKVLLLSIFFSSFATHVVLFSDSKKETSDSTHSPTKELVEVRQVEDNSYEKKKYQPIGENIEYIKESKVNQSSKKTELNRLTDIFNSYKGDELLHRLKES